MGGAVVSGGEPVGGVADRLAAPGASGRGLRSGGRSERSLIAGAQAGSERDLEALFRRHWPRAYRAAFLDRS